MVKLLIRWKRPWCWERLKAGGEGDDRGWDVWMASPTRWTWVWVSSGSWWWTGRPGVLQSMGSERIRHGWATELNGRVKHQSDGSGSQSSQLLSWEAVEVKAWKRGEVREPTRNKWEFQQVCWAHSSGITVSSDWKSGWCCQFSSSVNCRGQLGSIFYIHSVLLTFSYLYHFHLSHWSISWLKH